VIVTTAIAATRGKINTVSCNPQLFCAKIFADYKQNSNAYRNSDN